MPRAPAQTSPQPAPAATAGVSAVRAGWPPPLPARPLPAARKVLAVTARPGQESVDLGALLYVLRRDGATLMLLSVTRGEASPLNSTCEKLEAVRVWELHAAAGILGISSVAVADFPDGRLGRCPVEAITERVEREIGRHLPDLLLIVDPVTGGPDEAVVAQAVCAAASRAGVPAVARAVPGAGGGWLTDLGAHTADARAIQRSAAEAHASQAAAIPTVNRHLSSLGSGERLHCLVAGRRTGESQARERVSVI
jgi:N-acetylglucosamine malate deacetylase 2